MLSIREQLTHQERYRQLFRTRSYFWTLQAKIADPDDKLDGYRKVAGYLEAEVYLKDSKLLESGINKLTEQAISLGSITKQALLEVK